MADLEALEQAIESGDRATAVRLTSVRLTSEAVASGVAPQAILDAMTQAMAVTEARFQGNEIFVPEMLIAAREALR